METELAHPTITGLRVRLDDWVEGLWPNALLRTEWPKDIVRYAWIPQTICDQIWVLFEFPSVQSRAAWEVSVINPLIRSWISREVIPFALSYGWNLRNTNGFVQKSFE